MLFHIGSGCAQSLPFTNHTEIGILQNNQAIGPHTSFTFQTFNGVKANRWLSLGFTTGVDTYEQTEIIPFALGARAELSSDTKFSTLFGLDTGLGAALFEKDTDTEWTEGGFLINPTVGLLMKTGGKAKLSLTLGYKRQVISEFTGVLDPTNITGENGLPSGYHSINQDKFTFNRASVRLGVFF
ncbi:hypothetical protein [Echinicola rosea]|uniref:Outer membrane protein beta-barrel domain-containing protein n=1 Tax=Echinicola rosea TaxID=1807691 RepID=A0ABQ1V827_9BACT|nr:hypothetical protein [Echinicola rosea]GGF41867.1 hypothetical protein GCM10011339_33000 [Echinicola rosea]